jgi:PAS domain S-box-containing protein
VVIGGDGTVMLVNRRLETMFGYDRGELVGKPLEILAPERLREGHSRLRALFDRDPQPRAMGAGRELFGRRKDGSELPVEIALNPVSTAAGNFVMATVIDISARRLGEKRLSAAVAERDDLRRRFLQAQEGERLRLAHDLHDQTGQSIAAAMLELKGIESLAGDAERDRLRLLRRQMEEIGKFLHRVAWELRPASIDEVGLAGALNNYLSEWSTQYGIGADLWCGAALDDLSDEYRTTIYRVVQEALTNVTKHARKATEVSVVIERTDALLRLTIDDNGFGFDLKAVEVRESGRIGGGLGLAGMRERVTLIGGTLEIESSLRSGTTIYVRIPLPQETSVHERPIANLAG